MKKSAIRKAVEQRIFLIRGQRVMLSTHLAEMYLVPAGALIQAVKRNWKRFPKDFMYQLTRQEVAILKSQIVISSWGGMRRAMPYAFTEQGVAMLSSVLKSERAIQVNIAIMRAFIKLRGLLSSNRKLAQKLNELEQKVEKHDTEIQSIFDVIHQLMNPPESPRRRIGFHPEKTNDTDTASKKHKILAKV